MTATANPIRQAWESSKAIYDQIPEEVRGNITREAWDNVMPWVMTTAAKDVKENGTDVAEAILKAFASFQDFMAEMAEGRTDRAKAARKVIMVSTYNEIRSRQNVERALSQLERELDA